MKTCTTCKQEKPEDQFHKNCRQPDGRSIYCAACVKEKKIEQMRIKPNKKATDAWANSIIWQLSGRDY